MAIPRRGLGRARRPGLCDAGLRFVRVNQALADFDGLSVASDDSVEECRSAHLASTIVLETVGDATGSWDPDRIEQALTNLITNAIQYGAASRVRVQSVASAAHTVEIKVHSGGAVIPADVLPELFKAYRRGIRGKPAGRQGGVGLGLFIVAQIARRTAVGPSRSRRPRPAPRSPSSCRDRFEGKDRNPLRDGRGAIQEGRHGY